MEFFARPELFKYFGLIGVVIGLIGVIVPSLVYRGTKGEKYSFLNHYISELGETGVSKLAWVFNLGMILSGICIIVASLSLGLVLPGFWAKAGLVLGVASGAALSLVGVFPMNKMERHFKAAVAFFRGGLLMVLFFSLAIVLQSGENPLLPRELGLLGMIPVLAFGVFIGLMWSVRNQDHEALDTAGLERPKVWKFAISEWSIYFSFVVWILVVALVL
jgi:hypothetical membrane protein